MILLLSLITPYNIAHTAYRQTTYYFDDRDTAPSACGGAPSLFINACCRSPSPVFILELEIRQCTWGDDILQTFFTYFPLYGRNIIIL